jgi:hypothetical protein
VSVEGFMGRAMAFGPRGRFSVRDVRRVVVLAVALGLLLGAPAEATHVITPNGHRARPYQRWADHAKVPTPRGYVTVYDAPCPDGWWACYINDGRRIYLDPAVIKTTLNGGDATERMVMRLAFLHELFHDFDETDELADADRARFERIMGLRGPWRQADHDTSPNEAFADAGAACAVRPRITVWTTDVVGGNYMPTPRQHRRVCALIRRAAR